jgi:hypothetical protein
LAIREGSGPAGLGVGVPLQEQTVCDLAIERQTVGGPALGRQTTGEVPLQQ